MAINFTGKNRVYLLSLLLIFIQFQAYSQVSDCPPANSCGECAGDYISLTLQYNGAFGAIVSATDGAATLYVGVVPPGGMFTVSGSQDNGKFHDDQLNLGIALIPNFTLETDCGSPIGINSTFGSFTVVAAKSKDGGLLCCAPRDEDATPPR